MQNTSDIWTIIINWKRPHETCACLRSMPCDVDLSKVVVIDNGSGDDSVGIIQEQFPDVTILCMVNNLGFGKAANIGIKYALEQNAWAILLLNNDTQVESNTLKQIANFMASSPEVGIASPKIFLSNNPQRLWAVGGMYRENCAINIGSNEYDTGQYDNIQLDFVYGCAMLLRSNMLKKIGLFDEQFFMYYEDVDICLRARKAGFTVALVPNTCVLHLSSQSTNDNPARKVFYESRSRVLFYAKHLRRNELLPFIISEVQYFSLLMLRRLIVYDVKGAAAYIQGYASALLLLLYYRRAFVSLIVSKAYNAVSSKESNDKSTK